MEERLWLDALCARMVTLGTSRRPSAPAFTRGVSRRRREDVDVGDNGGTGEAVEVVVGGKSADRDSQRRDRGSEYLAYNSSV